MQAENKMELKFLGISVNEGFARVCAGAFASQLNPTIEEVADIKTAISEAVTNSIVHGYPGRAGEVILRGWLEPGAVVFEVEDTGVGIGDLDSAMQPFFTTCKGEERSGMGFTVMQTFMDEVSVRSTKGAGTCVRLTKRIEQEK